MIANLNQEVGSDVFVAVNAMQMQNDFISNPRAFGPTNFPFFLSLYNNLDN